MESRFKSGKTWGNGYGTIQSLQKLKKRIYQHKPKFVVLLFYAWNDIRDNLNTPGIYYSPEMQKRPYYVNENSFDLIRPQFKDSWITNLAVYKELFFKIKPNLIIADDGLGNQIKKRIVIGKNIYLIYIYLKSLPLFYLSHYSPVGVQKYLSLKAYKFFHV